MMGGRQPYLVAAMKSLPLREDNETANSSLAEREMVSYLIAECSRQLEGELLSPYTIPIQTCGSYTTLLFDRVDSPSSLAFLSVLCKNVCATELREVKVMYFGWCQHAVLSHVIHD